MPLAKKTATNKSVLTAEEKREILSDPELKKELLNTDEAKAEIEKLISAEEITKIIEKKVEEKVGSQMARMPEQHKQWSTVMLTDRHIQMVER